MVPIPRCSRIDATRCYAPVAPHSTGYWPRPGDPVPSLFHPYATAHRFDLTHFNQTNALAGLMLGVSFPRPARGPGVTEGYDPSRILLTPILEMPSASVL
jgi:hypothetical protein